MSKLFQPIDIGLLVYFRVAFGVIMLWEVSRFFSRDWIINKFVTPEVHFTYLGFSWIRPWQGTESDPALGMNLHFIALGILAAMISVGLCYRLACVLFGVGFAYVFLLDQTEYLNHFYMVVLLSGLLAVVPAHRAGSIDAWLRPAIRSTTAPAWTLLLLRFQIAIVYFFGGVAKLNSDWLHGEPMRMYLATKTSFPVLGPYLTKEWMVYLFTYGGLLLDLGIVPFLLWKRTRTAAFFVIVTFHVLNNRLFQIGIFPWMMVAATMLFFPPEWLSLRKVKAKPEKVRGRKSGRNRVSGSGSKQQQSGVARQLNAKPQPTWREHAVACALGVYVLVQISFPLRHWLYPGNVSWTEEGHRFAWHMKLRVKQPTNTVFTATDVDGNQFTWRMSPRGYEPPAVLFLAVDSTGETLDFDDPAPVLTGRQFGAMSCKPGMTLQYAHRLADALTDAGFRDVEVYVDSRVSLNTRKPQMLIDPDRDLTHCERSLWPADWIMPLTEPLPAR